MATTTITRIELLKKSLADDPNDSFSRYALALEYDSAGEVQLAIATLRELIERNAKYIPAYHQLGRIYSRQNQSEEAKAIYRRGIEAATSPDDIHEKREMDEELEELEDEW
jgi:tetratricopeptide (TPR) repeat protein